MQVRGEKMKTPFQELKRMRIEIIRRAAADPDKIVMRVDVKKYADIETGGNVTYTTLMKTMIDRKLFSELFAVRGDYGYKLKCGIKHAIQSASVQRVMSTPTQPKPTAVVAKSIPAKPTTLPLFVSDKSAIILFLQGRRCYVSITINKDIDAYTDDLINRFAGYGIVTESYIRLSPDKVMIDDLAPMANLVGSDSRREQIYYLLRKQGLMPVKANGNPGVLRDYYDADVIKAAQSYEPWLSERIAAEVTPFPRHEKSIAILLSNTRECIVIVTTSVDDYSKALSAKLAEKEIEIVDTLVLSPDLAKIGQFSPTLGKDRREQLYFLLHKLGFNAVSPSGMIDMSANYKNFAMAEIAELTYGKWLADSLAQSPAMHKEPEKSAVILLMSDQRCFVSLVDNQIDINLHTKELEDYFDARDCHVIKSIALTPEQSKISQDLGCSADNRRMQLYYLLHKLGFTQVKLNGELAATGYDKWKRSRMATEAVAAYEPWFSEMITQLSLQTPVQQSIESEPGMSIVILLFDKNRCHVTLTARDPLLHLEGTSAVFAHRGIETISSIILPAEKARVALGNPTSKIANVRRSQIYYLLSKNNLLPLGADAKPVKIELNNDLISEAEAFYEPWLSEKIASIRESIVDLPANNSSSAIEQSELQANILTANLPETQASMIANTDDWINDRTKNIATTLILIVIAIALSVIAYRL